MPAKKRNLLTRLIHVGVHIAAILPLLWLFWAIPRGMLGGDPVKELTHFLGIGALRLLLLSLAVTPLAKITKIGTLMKLRRPLGLWCFVWASLHFTTWMALDLAWQWQLIGSEIVKRVYIVVGFIAWLILLVLAVTSLPSLVRKLGKYWKKLHATVYLVLVLACLHFWWSLKSGWLEPAIYAVVAILLLWYRKKKIAGLVKLPQR